MSDLCPFIILLYGLACLSNVKSRKTLLTLHGMCNPGSWVSKWTRDLWLVLFRWVIVLLECIWGLVSPGTLFSLSGNEWEPSGGGEGSVTSSCNIAGTIMSCRCDIISATSWGMFWFKGKTLWQVCPQTSFPWRLHWWWRHFCGTSLHLEHHVGSLLLGQGFLLPASWLILEGIQWNWRSGDWEP